MSGTRGTPNVLLGMMGRFCDAYATFLAEGCRRPLTVGLSYLGRAAKAADEASLVHFPHEELLPKLLQGCANFAVEMAGIPFFAFDEARGVWEQDHPARPDSEAGRMREVDGKPVMLPVRFSKAKQGWALYRVDAVKAQAHLAAHGYGDTLDVLRFAGHALLIIYFTDFIETDLGSYQEIAVEFWVRPRGEPEAAPGTVAIRMSVNQDFTIQAAREIWKLHKLKTPEMNAIYHADGVEIAVDRADTNTLAVTLPRFGHGRSTDVPMRYFTVDDADAARRRRALRTVLHRSSEGEGVQFGGNVKLRLGDGTGDRCFCGIAAGPRVCTCKALADLGLPRLQPVANGWAEQMSGRVEAAYPVTSG